MGQYRPFAGRTQEDIIAEPTDKGGNGKRDSPVVQVIRSVQLPTLLGLQRRVSLLMAESAVMHTVGGKLVRAGQTKTASDIQLYHMSDRGCPHKS